MSLSKGVRTLGHAASVELGAAGGARHDRRRAVGEDGELVEVFAEPRRGLGDVDKAVFDHRGPRVRMRIVLSPVGEDMALRQIRSPA